MDTKKKWGIGPWSLGLLYLKGKLCSLRMAVSAYVLVSLSVDPSHVSFEWLLVCLGNNHLWAEIEKLNLKSLFCIFLESCLNIIEPY